MMGSLWIGGFGGDIRVATDSSQLGFDWRLFRVSDALNNDSYRDTLSVHHTQSLRERRIPRMDGYDYGYGYRR